MVLNWIKSKLTVTLLVAFLLSVATSTYLYNVNVSQAHTLAQNEIRIEALDASFRVFASKVNDQVKLANTTHRNYNVIKVRYDKLKIEYSNYRGKKEILLGNPVGTSVDATLATNRLFKRFNCLTGNVSDCERASDKTSTKDAKAD